jgi:hypothetical protein
VLLGHFSLSSATISVAGWLENQPPKCDLLHRNPPSGFWNSPACIAQRLDPATRRLTLLREDWLKRVRRACPARWQSERRSRQAGQESTWAASSLPESFLRNSKQTRHRSVPTLPIVTTRCRDQVKTHPALTQLAGESFIYAEQRVVFPA